MDNKILIQMFKDISYKTVGLMEDKYKELKKKHDEMKYEYQILSIKYKELNCEYSSDNKKNIDTIKKYEDKILELTSNNEMLMKQISYMNSENKRLKKNNLYHLNYITDLMNNRSNKNTRIYIDDEFEEFDDDDSEHIYEQVNIKKNNYQNIQ